MFIGDGINDSPVLAQAEVGCAINSASDITVSAAGIVLVKDDLLDVLRAIKIARKSFQRIKINFLFAFLYNVILIPIAMGLFYPIGKFKLDPMFAAVAMALSSISVVASSLCLKLYDPNDELDPAEQKNNRSIVKIGPSKNEDMIKVETTSMEHELATVDAKTMSFRSEEH